LSLKAENAFAQAVPPLPEPRRQLAMPSWSKVAAICWWVKSSSAVATARAREREQGLEPLLTPTQPDHAATCLGADVSMAALLAAWAR